MADPKTHAMLKKHLQNAAKAHKQVGDSMAEIEKIIGAMQGAQKPQPQQPTAPGMTAGPVSPLGGQAG